MLKNLFNYEEIIHFFLSFLLPLLASADAVEIDGIYYELNQEERIAKVTKNPNKYTGVWIFQI